MKRSLFALLFLLAFIAPVARADTLTVSNLAASNATATISAPSMGTVTFVVSGTFSATLTPKCSVDGINYQTATVTGPYPSTSTSTSITGAGTYQFPAAGWSYFQLVATSYTSGTAAVTEYASTAVLGGSSGGGGGGGSVTQGTSPWVVGQATGTNLHAVLDTTSTTAVTQATASNLNAMTTALPVALTDTSVTIATGGTAQTAIGAGTRHKFIIQNTSQNNAPVTFSWTGTAGAPGAAGSFVLQPYQFFTSDADGCSNQALSVNSPTTGATVTISYN